MIGKLLLALRNDGHRVAVIKTEGSTREQLGVTHPEEQQRRVKALKQWGIHAASPRHDAPATIDEPLPQRSQTILSYRVEPALRQRLDTGMGKPAESRAQADKRAPGEADVRVDSDES
jgi:hypothetical protein